MASHTSYVIRRGSDLAVRRGSPLAARTFHAAAFFAYSPRTHVRSEGRGRAAIAARIADDLIGPSEACGADMPEDRQIDAVIDTLVRARIETVEALREIAGPRAAATRVHEPPGETRRAALVHEDDRAVHAPLERSFARPGIASPGAARHVSGSSAGSHRATKEKGIFEATAKS